MRNWEIGFSYKVEEYGTVILEADDKEDAEKEGLLHVREAYPEVTNIIIDYVKEV